MLPAPQPGAGLDAVFAPRRVALVGASEREGAVGTVLWRNLSLSAAEVVPVTTSAPKVGGVPAYARLVDVPGRVDLALVAVPAAAVCDVMSDAAAARVRAVVVFTGGFAETGEHGARLQQEMSAVARAAGVRLVGPNTFGVQSAVPPLNASLAAGSAQPGGVSLVTQSGAYGMLLHTLAREGGPGLARVCGSGNKADVDDTDLAAWLGDDPATRVLCFLVESLPRARMFCETVRRVAMTKAVVVARTTRTAEAARAAQSHTAAVTGGRELWDDVLTQCGAVLVRTGHDLLDAAGVLDTQPLPRGARVGIVTNSGGVGVELTDLCVEAGLSVPELPADLRGAIAALLPAHASARNPVDVTTVWPQFTQLYPAVIEALARSGAVDVVVPVLLQRSASPQVARAVRDAAGRLRADGVAVPVVVCWQSPRADRIHADLLTTAGVPALDGPERAVRAVAAAVRCAKARAVLRPAPDPPPRPAGLPVLAPGAVPVEAAAALLRRAGVPLADFEVCATAVASAAAVRRMLAPYVVKLLHPDVVHKSDVGGVRVGLATPEAVRAAAADLLQTAGARVLVQRQELGVELLVGAVRDPDLGPVVTVGLGGTLVEVLNDTRSALAPLHHDEALRLLGGLRGSAVLQGVRGAPAVDLDAVADVVRRVGDLVTAVEEIVELDLNPVLARPDGCCAVDWRATAGPPRERPESAPGGAERVAISP